MMSIFNLPITDPILKGILNGSRAFIGPEIVQFDLTNRCNNNCVCCWNNSPLLGEPSGKRKREKEYGLPYELVKKTIIELKRMGTKILFFAGGGEPSMHPSFIEIIKCAKDCGMKIFINTNFTLLDKDKIKRIVELKVDHIHVSLLAGNEKSYTLIHPNKTEENFFMIKDLLKYLAKLKEEKNQLNLPHINMYYVIFNVNYLDIKIMVDLAREVKANSLEFTPMDAIPEKTDILLLNDAQRAEVLSEVKIQNKKIEEFKREYGVNEPFIAQYDSFINRLSAKKATQGEYENNIVLARPCYVGWAFLRILANGNVNPCLKAHRISIGNIYKHSIRDIWNSRKQQLFRVKSFKLDTNDRYFRIIGNNPNSKFGCLNSCDNIQINLEMHDKYGEILKEHGRIKLNNLIKDRNKLLVIGGILHSSRAFLGPEVLHIDLTNHCNFNCIACWCRSPLLEDKAMPDWERKLTLPLDLLKSVFDDLGKMGGLRQVKLVGGGEPFMHPDILKIVEYIKNKDRNIEIDINTNFSLVDEKTIERLLELEVNSFTVSIWAGTPEVYVAVHPNQTERTFYRIKDMLKFIFEQKKKLNRSHPKIIIHDVIFNLNYKDLEHMLSFALDVGADDIQFVPMDPVKRKTEILLFNDLERNEFLNKLFIMRKRYDAKSFRYIFEDGKSVLLSDFNGFIRRIETLDTTTGAYDEIVVEKIPCYIGWLFARIMTTGNVVPCCKGHRMPLGNIYKDRFRDIWFSKPYGEFRYNCLNLPKSNPYFSKIGNDAIIKVGCYNCDNLSQNIPIHNNISLLKSKNPHLISFCRYLLKNIFRNDKQDIR